MTKNKRIFTIANGFRVLGILLIGFIIYAGVKAYPRIMDAKNRYSQLLIISDELNQMVDDRDFDIERGTALFDDANLQVQGIQADVRPYYGFFNVVSKLPWVGKYAGQVEPIVEYIKCTFDAVGIIVDVVVPAIDSSVYADGKLQIMQQVIAAQPQLDIANGYISMAELYSSQIQPDLLPENIQPKLEKFNSIYALAVDGINLLNIIPEVAGAPTPVTYLIMLQNSNELRPTGGLITAFGLIHIEQGNVTLMEFTGSEKYEFMSEVLEAPEPIKQILIASYWLPRDGNWSPSFPESAKQVQHLFYLSTGVNTDGVIAINQSTIQKLLSFTGPIDIEGKEVSSETLIEFMIEYELNAKQIGVTAHRKDFIPLLATGLMEKLSQQTGKDQLIALFKLAREMTAQGELLLFSNNPDVQSILEKYKIDGALYPGTGDYLLLVDANLGYDKNDLVIKRNIQYAVDLSNLSSPKSNLTISYSNPLVGEVTCQQGNGEVAVYLLDYVPPNCYADYFRLYRPEEAQITSYQLPGFEDSFFIHTAPWSHDLTISPFNNGLIEAGGFFVLPPETASTTTINQTLPSDVVSMTDEGISIYTLTIQKQPGISELPVELSLTLPSDTVIDAENSNITLVNENGIWRWKGNLRESITEVRVVFKGSS